MGFNDVMGPQRIVPKVVSSDRERIHDILFVVVGKPCILLLPFPDITPITFTTIVDTVPLALFNSFGVVCVVMRAELRTAQTRRLANHSRGCTVSESATRLHRGDRRGLRYKCCRGAHILFTTASRGKLCVSPIITRWRHIRV